MYDYIRNNPISQLNFYKNVLLTYENQKKLF